MWKEVEVGGSGGFVKLAATVFALLVAGSCFVAYYHIFYAFFELVSNGRLSIWNRMNSDTNARRALNLFLSMSGKLLIGLWLLCVGGAALTGALRSPMSWASTTLAT